MKVKSAEIKTLTAEIKTLSVDNRQVTLSMVKQLDVVEREMLEVFGRVRITLPDKYECHAMNTPRRKISWYLIGRNKEDKSLCLAAPDFCRYGEDGWPEYEFEDMNLPLLILAGLK